MAQRIGGIVLALVAVFVCAATRADEKAPTLDQTLSLLSNREYAELDRRFSSVQQSYENGSASDVQLRDAFRAFYFATPSVAGNFDEWVEQFPRSYVARLARGIYYKRIGEEIRGGDAASRASAEDFPAMEAAMAEASSDFEQSLTLDKKPLLSLLHQLTVYQLLGRNGEERAVLDQSIALDRNNYVVRYAYMVAIDTRWGGSVEQMKEFLKECREAHLSPSELNSLEALVVGDQAWTDRYVKHDDDAAVHAYRREAKLNPHGSCEPCGPIHQAADVLLEQKKYTEAINLYSKVLRRDPQAVDALNSRAFSELQVRQPKQAVRDFTQAAQLGSAYAQDMLGRMYLVGTSVPQDRDKAIEWLSKAADQGYAPSQELLVVAKDRNRLILAQPGGPRF